MREKIEKEVMKVYDQEASVDKVVDKLLVLFGVVNRQGTVNLKPVESINERLKQLYKLREEFEGYENGKIIHRKELDLLKERIKTLEWVLN